MSAQCSKIRSDYASTMSKNLQVSSPRLSWRYTLVRKERLGIRIRHDVSMEDVEALGRRLIRTQSYAPWRFLERSGLNVPIETL